MENQNKINPLYYDDIRVIVGDERSPRMFAELYPDILKEIRDVCDTILENMGE